MSQTQIQPLPPHAVRGAAAVMARAFHDDPGWAWIIRDGERRRRVLPFVFQRALRLEAGRGDVFTAAGGAGVAVWVRPGTPWATAWRNFRAGLWQLPLLLHRDERRRLRRYLAVNAELHGAVVFGQHWYLTGLGVDPPRQRQGIGGQLLAWGVEQAALARLPVALLTANEDNVKYYEQRGFVVAAVRGDPMPMWGMIRR